MVFVEESMACVPTLRAPPGIVKPYVNALRSKLLETPQPRAAYTPSRLTLTSRGPSGGEDAYPPASRFLDLTSYLMSSPSVTPYITDPSADAASEPVVIWGGNVPAATGRVLPVRVERVSSRRSVPVAGSSRKNAPESVVLSVEAVTISAKPSAPKAIPSGELPSASVSLVLFSRSSMLSAFDCGMGAPLGGGATLL